MKVGILGGGQLGRMLLQAAANYPVEVHVMENADDCPAAYLCHHFVRGDIKNSGDVFEFGKNLDAVTIEIESVSVEGLKKLRDNGVRVFPSPEALDTIKNKIIQKEFYSKNSIPTPHYLITQNAKEVRNYADFIPAVHKAATGGYDGRGVQVLNDEKDFDKAFDVPSVLEKKVNIQKEISIIIGINEKGETAIYPPSEMVFDPVLNLLEYQLSPANIPEKVRWKAEAIALSVVKNLNSAGIFAIEQFVDTDGNVWVNETAPRVHNSGHDTIEGNYSSQFDMAWRIILNLPLGNTQKISSTALVNLIGFDHSPVNESNAALIEILKMDKTFVHLYGKKENRPGRKMGHVTILGNDRPDLVHNANKVRQLWEGRY
jgi:5-(carboxyamino)imidazole ribonucleotide synthase